MTPPWQDIARHSWCDVSQWGREPDESLHGDAVRKLQLTMVLLSTRADLH